ncbi:hypothetical protein UF37_20695, partial [Vibrio parahaemolyticus]
LSVRFVVNFNFSTFKYIGAAVFDGIFHQGLKCETWQLDIGQLWVDIYFYFQALREACFFDTEVRIDVCKLFFQRHRIDVLF